MATKKAASSKTSKKKADTAVRSAVSPAPAASAAASAPVREVPLTPSAPVTTKVTKEERHRMIAEAAYYLSLRRGPASDPLKNWLEAEAQIDAQLKRDGRL